MAGRLFICLFIRLIIGGSLEPARDAEKKQHKSCRLRQILEDFHLKQTMAYPELLITSREDLAIALAVIL